MTIALGDKTWTLDVAENLGKEKPLEGSPFAIRIEDYWPDFRITDGKPASVSDQPNNPAAVVILKGKAVPVASAPDPHRNDEAPAMSGSPSDGAANHLTLFVSDNSEITYELRLAQAWAFLRQTFAQSAAPDGLGRLEIDHRPNVAARSPVDGFQSGGGVCRRRKRVARWCAHSH